MSRDRWSWAGIWIIGITAATWSFTALADLATLVGVTATFTVPVVGWTVRVAWGLPLTVDVFAVIATRMWLRGTAPAAAVTCAQRAAWVAIACSVVGNAYHGWLTGDGRLDGVIVSAVPAVAIGALVHLAVLAAGEKPGFEAGDSLSETPNQPQTSSPDSSDESSVSSPSTSNNAIGDPAVSSPSATVAEPAAGSVQPRRLALATPPETDVDKARRLLAEGAGRPALCKELRIGDGHAKTLKAVEPHQVTAEMIADLQARAAANERRRA